MDKKNKIYIGIIIFCTVLVIILCAYAIINHKTNILEDNVKFKNEYEVLNGVTNDNNGYEYPTVKIEENNNVIYKSDVEILEVLKNEKAIVYFGFSSCPWCRNMISELLNITKENNIEKVYYVDIKNIRDTYTYDNNIIPKQTKKGSDAYYKILEFFSDKLDKYYVEDENKNKYDTGITRLYAPTVIAINEGKILDMHVGTVESQKDPYVKLNDEQTQELREIFQKLVETIKEKCDNASGTC